MKVYASISGGKDSLAALITHIERGGQCDGAIYCRIKDAFLAAYIQKHRIFAIRADIEPQEMSLEESIKMSALMRGMSDESPLRAIEAGK